MRDDGPWQDPRSAALDAVAAFVARHLEPLVRATSRRAGLARPRIDELVEEARQELYVDALEHPDAIAAADADASHPKPRRRVNHL